MKTFLNRFFVFSLVFAATFIPSQLSAQQKPDDFKTVTLSDTLDTAQIQRVELTGARGMKVILRGYDGKSVIYAWTVSGAGKPFVDLIKNSAIDANKKDGTLTLSITVPGNSESTGIHSDSEESWLKQLISPSKQNRSWNNEKRELSQTFEVLIPNKLLVDVTANYSEISADQLSGGLTIRNKAGSVTTFRTAGKLEIENRYGRISVRESRGETIVNGKSGSVDVDDSFGSLLVNSDYSSISISRHEGNINVENQSGKITVDELTGDAKLSGKYGSVKVNAVSGKLDITNQSGSVVVDGAGSLHVRNENGSIKASKIKGIAPGMVISKNGSVDLNRVLGEFTVDLNNGSVEARDGKGTLKIVNRNGAIYVNKHTGNLDVSSESAEIDLKAIDGETIVIRNKHRSIDAEILAFKKLDVSNEGGNVRLELPSKPDGTIDVRVEEGTISGSAIAIEKIRELDRVKTVLVTGGGSGTVQIRIKNGNLTMQSRAL